MQSIYKSVHPHSEVNVPLNMYLCDNEIHEEGASRIAEILSNTSIVSKLWLSRNPIGDKGLQTIFKTLKQNKTLKAFSVHNCGMIDTEMTSLADALQSNTLEILNCTSNEAVTENGLVCLAEALSRQSGLAKCTWLPSHLEGKKSSMKLEK